MLVTGEIVKYFSHVYILSRMYKKKKEKNTHPSIPSVINMYIKRVR